MKTSTDPSSGSQDCPATPDAEWLRPNFAPQPGRRDQQPAWSPDGKTIAFVRERITGEGVDLGLTPPVIHVVEATGRGPRRLTAGSSPDWSPDSKRIVFERKDGVYIIGADGRERTRLVRVPLKEAIDLNPKWSPDGKSILYVTGRDPVTVWMMDPEGNQRTRLFKRKGRFLGLGWDPDRG